MTTLFFCTNRGTLGQNRRGVILLLVMSVLALFSVVGITFVLMTGRSREAAETMAKTSPGAATAGMTPQQLLEEGITQVLVGPGMDAAGNQDNKSALYHNDLLGDMYGWTGSETTTATFTQGSDGSCTCSLRGNNFAGRVVTITSGKYKGYSTLIINNEGTCLPFSKGAPSGESVNVVVNNRPFQGNTGYDAVSSTDSENNKFMSLRYPGGAGDSPKPGMVVIPSYFRNNETRPGCTSDCPKSVLTVQGNHTDGWEIDNDGDGKGDSVWINAGLPPQAMPDGTMVVPMFAILTEDLDGRLNVNACGLPDSSGDSPTLTINPNVDSVSKLINAGAKKTADEKDFIGMGIGPAEISLAPLFTSKSNYAAFFNVRNDNSTKQSYLKYKYPDLINIAYPSQGESPDNYSFTFNARVPHYCSPWDLSGRMISGMDSNGMHVWLQAQNTVNSPYETFNLGHSIARAEREMFTPDELEAALRVYDSDSAVLCNRLLEKLQVSDAKQFNIIKNIITTESWDIPSCDIKGFSDSASANLPAEVLAGFKMDINRPLTDYQTNAIQADKERTQLASDLFYLLRAACPNVSMERAAQWAVNAVDFRDSDNVCTRFSIGAKYYFGCERPELLITETFAYHDRKTENTSLMGWNQKLSGGAKELDISDHIDDPLEIYAKDNCVDYSTFIKAYPKHAEKLGYRDEENANNDEAIEKIESICQKVRANDQNGVVSLEQMKRPESGLFIELYNPWLSVSSTEPSCKDVYKEDSGVNLGKNPLNSSPVWEIAIVRPDKMKTSFGAGDYAKGFNGDPERLIVFGSSGGEQSADYKYHASQPEASIKPGAFAIVGSSQTAECPIPITRANATLFPVDKEDSSPVRLSISESKKVDYVSVDSGAYRGTDEQKKAPADSQDKSFWEGENSVKRNGLYTDFYEEGYRFAVLQRLANPYEAWNKNSNPYICVDAMPIDLVCYNSEQSDYPDYKNGATYNSLAASQGDRSSMDSKIKTCQRDANNIWKSASILGSVGSASVRASKDQSSFGNAVYKKSSTIDYNNVPGYYFPNRPFASIMELMLVPQVSCFELTSSDKAIQKVGYGQLPAYLSEIDFSSNAAKFFNYVRVQSPCNAAPMVLDAFPNGTKPSATSQYRWTYREPGRVNINSMNHPAVWAGLLNRPSLNSHPDMLNKAGTASSMSYPGLSTSDVWTKVFQKDYAQKTVKTTFGVSDKYYLLGTNFNNLRLSAATGVQYNDPTLSPYFQLPLLQRLSNLTTTRSNVYAVWVTVGFFEYRGLGKGAKVVSPYRIGKEYGIDSGSMKRYRAFYLIDRTIPVGYEPGKRHNADQTILLRRYLP